MDYKKWLIKNYYSLACLVIFAVLFYMGVGNLFGHTLAHDYPFTYFAEDPFSSLKAAISLKDLGHNLYVAPYMNLGIEKSLPHHGPGLAHWIVINDSLTNNIGMHNSMQLLVGLIFISLPFIFINSLKLKKPVKILSLSLTPLLFQTNWVIAYLWGQIGAIMGAFFMFSFFMVYNSKKWKNPWITAIILSAACIVHFPEGFFLMFFIAIAFAADAYSKRKKLLGNGLKGAIKEYKWLILSAIIFLVITGFYLIIFYYGNLQKFDEASSETAKKGIFTFVTPDEFAGIKTVKITDFNWILLLGIIAGMVILLIFYKSRTRYILFFTLAITFLNYYGFFMLAAYRAFQHRAFWPFTLMPFFSIAVFFILKEFLKIKEKKLAIILIIAAVAIFIYSVSSYRMLTGPGVITKEQFDALQYLDNNKNDNGTVLFVYEDGYTQFHPALKSLYSITQEKNMALVLQQKADIKDSFSFLRVEYGTPAVIKGMKIELVNREYYFNASFCDFDYYILDKISPFGNELIQFNKVLMDSMNQDSLGLFYQNSQTLVLKRKSDNCWREEDDNK